MGWIYESIYCTIRAKKWENRGFLYGPLCPIYGAGGVAITAIADFISAHTDATFTWWQIFLVAFLGSIVLEYGTSWALEKLFHAYWWDYSSMPLNINGRVCFPYSVGFGVAGLIVVYFIAPFTKLITGWMSPIWYEFFSLLLMGFLAVDTAITVSALTDFSRTIVNLQNNFNTYMDEVVEEVKRSLGPEVYRTIIPRNIRLGEAPSHGLPITMYADKSKGAESYRLLAEEVMEKEWK